MTSALQIIIINNFYNNYVINYCIMIYLYIQALICIDLDTQHVYLIHFQYRGGGSVLVPTIIIVIGISFCLIHCHIHIQNL